MPTMMDAGFWVAGFCLWLGLFAVALYPLSPLYSRFKQRHVASHQQMLTENIQQFKQRLAELQQDVNAGRLNQQAYQQQKTQLQRQLLQLEQLIDVAIDEPVVSGQTAIKQASKKEINSHENKAANKADNHANNQANDQANRQSNRQSKWHVKKLVGILLLSSLIMLVGLYQWVSNRDEVHQFWQAQQQFAQTADAVLTSKTANSTDLSHIAVEDIPAFLAVLQTNVHQHANDADRWLRLSEVLTGMQATDAALQAMTRAYRLDSNNESLAAAYAQMRFFANGGRLDDTTRQVIANILAQNPNHEGSQMLLIMGEIKAGDDAINNSSNVTNDANNRNVNNQLSSNKHYAVALSLIDELRDRIIKKAGNHTQALLSLQQLVTMIEDKQQTSVTAQVIEVSIRLAKEVQAFVKSTDVLFLIAQDVNTGTAFAVKPVKMADINLAEVIKLQLTDQDVVMPSLGVSQLLSQQSAGSINLALTARISHSGKVKSQSQDLIANPVLLTNTQPISLIINQKIP